MEYCLCAETKKQTIKNQTIVVFILRIPNNRNTKFKHLKQKQFLTKFKYSITISDK